MLKAQILEFDRRIMAWHRSNETSRRLDVQQGDSDERQLRGDLFKRADDHALSPHGPRVSAITSSGANFDVIKQQKYLARTLLSLETAMANKNDFTPEEWTKVLESIIAAGIAVSAVDPSGLWGTLKEAAAGTPALAAAKRDPNSNELIKAAVAAFERSDDGSILAMRERFAQAEPTECVQRSLASLREVSAIVDAKAPDEAAAFKTWLREISQKVAEAAVEGSFLGFGGVRVSDAETATLRDISKALGMAS